jgi:hypothetical protein
MSVSEATVDAKTKFQAPITALGYDSSHDGFFIRDLIKSFGQHKLF